jgi:hypothetical protein
VLCCYTPKILVWNEPYATEATHGDGARLGATRSSAFQLHSSIYCAQLLLLRNNSSSSGALQAMPRFTVRNVVVLFNIVLLTALFVHLKQVLWNRHDSPADLGLSHLPDELLDDSITVPLRHQDDKQLQVNAGPKARRTAVVVASQASENATWLNHYFPTWEMNIYHVDDPDAPLTVPKNKGRESMVYLTCVSLSSYPFMS